MSKNYDHEFLKERTLHIKGIQHDDRGGNMLMNQLDKVIGDIGGQIKGIIIVPDMIDLLRLNGEKLDLKDLKMLIDAKELTGGEPYTNFCIPKRYKNAQ